ncbi:MAG: Xaa-Pro dipeptidase, partial [Oscillospiraceae bacterium]|nr:Xaa-Pro dipeptidase [Oscillospiraceae bacterium]
MLAECHAHAALDGVDWRSALARHKPAPNAAFIREILAAYRDAGVGYVRDGGDACGAAELAAMLAPEYGIEYRM